MIPPLRVFQLSSRRQSPFPAPQCFAQSRRRLQDGHEALAPAGYTITAKHVHHVEPSFTTIRKRYAQRLIHRLANGLDVVRVQYLLAFGEVAPFV